MPNTIWQWIPADQEKTMSRVFPRLAGGAIVAVALMAAAGDTRADNGVTPVIVQNPVTAADIAKAEGIQHPTSFEIIGDTINGQTTYQVPANQRLIIEFASGTCLITRFNLDLVELDFVQSNNAQSSVILNIPQTQSNSTISLNFGELLRIYVEPSTTVRISPVGNQLGQELGQINCSGRFFGQLIDVP